VRFFGYLFRDFQPKRVSQKRRAAVLSILRGRFWWLKGPHQGPLSAKPRGKSIRRAVFDVRNSTPAVFHNASVACLNCPLLLLFMTNSAGAAAARRWIMLTPMRLLPNSWPANPLGPGCVCLLSLSFLDFIRGVFPVDFCGDFFLIKLPGQSQEASCGAMLKDAHNLPPGEIV
jgi:hypothetical protein